MWLYRTGRYSTHPVALYDYQSRRSAKHTLTFLQGFSGYLHCDGYSAYKKLPEDVKLVGCLAHARREFDEAVTCLTPEQAKTSKAKIGLDYCNKLFALEIQFTELPPEKRLILRHEQERPVFDGFLSWLNSCNAAPKSHFGRAVQYTLRQWPYFETIFLDGRAGDFQQCSGTTCEIVCSLPEKLSLLQHTTRSNCQRSDSKCYSYRTGQRI